MTFFFDRCTSPRIARMVHAYEAVHTTRHHDDDARFTKTTLHNLLTNVIYTGRVKYEGELRDGEHERIIEDDTWNRVQEQLNRNGRRGGRNVRNKHGALLKGLLQCASCKCGMTHTYAQKTGTSS